MTPYREANLERALKGVCLPWTKHSDYHWSMQCGTKRANYWPSTLKFRWKPGGKFTMEGIEIETAEQMVLDASPVIDPTLPTPFWLCAEPGCYNGGPTCFRRVCPNEKVIT